MPMINFYSSERIGSYVTSIGEVVSFFDYTTTLEADSLAAKELRAICADPMSSYSLTKRVEEDTSVVEEIKTAAAAATKAELAAIKK